ncbi:TolC family protein [Prochlorothrix hollandica]|uniref:TolC family protein n=1 Tax=Prochlorothrix hollandica TaxID=1223 RepID=UPI000344E8BF|nr:TolC family protein [Prochlorothrix hollandica]
MGVGTLLSLGSAVTPGLAQAPPDDPNPEATSDQRFSSPTLPLPTLDPAPTLDSGLESGVYPEHPDPAAIAPEMAGHSVIMAGDTAARDNLTGNSLQFQAAASDALNQNLAPDSTLDGGDPPTLSSPTDPIAPTLGNTVNPLAVEGEMGEEYTADGSASDGSASDGSTSDGSTADGSTSDGSTSDGSTADGSTSIETPAPILENPASEPFPFSATPDFDAAPSLDIHGPQIRDLLTDSNPLERPVDPSQVEVTDVLALTLEEVRALALRNNRSLQVQELTLRQQWEALRQQQAQRYPTVTLDSNLQQTGTNTAVLSSSEFSSAANSSQGTANLNGTVRVDYDLYAPSRDSTIRAAQHQVRQGELLLEQAKEQLRLDVATDYYDLQQADEQVRIADGAVKAAQLSLKDAQSLERAGVGTRFAVLQAEVQLANEQQTLVNAQADQLKAQRQLVQRLSLPQHLNVVAADSVVPAGEWAYTLADSIILAYQNRPELEQRLVERDLSEAQRNTALAAIRPSVGVFGQYTLDTTLTGNSSAGTDVRQNTFAGQYRVGLNLSWQLFDGGAAKAAARQRDLDRETAELEFANSRNQVRQQVEESYYDLRANIQNIQTAGQGVDQAAEALRLARLRFQAGVGTQIDVINAERDLTQAEGNRSTAILGYNRALVRMQRAVSNFSQIPLNATNSPGN